MLFFFCLGMVLLNSCEKADCECRIEPIQQNSTGINKNVSEDSFQITNNDSLSLLLPLLKKKLNLSGEIDVSIFQKDLEKEVTEIIWQSDFGGDCRFAHQYLARNGYCAAFEWACSTGNYDKAAELLDSYNELTRQLSLNQNSSDCYKPNIIQEASVLIDSISLIRDNLDIFIKHYQNSFKKDSIRLNFNAISRMEYIEDRLIIINHYLNLYRDELKNRLEQAKAREYPIDKLSGDIQEVNDSISKFNLEIQTFRTELNA